MASLDVAQRQTKDALPPIANLDFEKYRFDPIDNSRYTMPGINRFGTTMSSPPSAYSAPPPPYTSGVTSSQGMSGYISPPESSSRRSTRDEKESPKGTNSLPSISEALKSADMPPVSAQSYTPVSAPGSAVAQTFTEAPKGPGNPFSQPVAPASALRSSFSSGTEPPSISTLPPPPVPPDAKSAPLNTTGSPSSSLSAHKLSGPFPPASGQLEPPFRSSYSSDSSQRGYPYPDYSLSHLSTSSAKFHFEPQSKLEDSQRTFAKSESRPYTETIKRHLDIYDAELALSELAESSAHSLEFAKVWSQRYHQSNRASYITDGLPSTAEVDEMLRNAHRMIENLSQLREVSIMQQNALNEQRARLAQGPHHEDDFHRLSDDFKVGGFAGGDAKKRRGKAAPPGRCHSCNRAETPEWRRGPDGARTLCNACGLHYAKLTRKMGANKAAVLTGSNLRPKSLNETRP